MNILLFLFLFLDIFKNPISSTFGESRETRYHLGIDISTLRKNRVPVSFPFETEVIRVKVNYEGYGKVLYLKGKDNYIYVLAHLDRFNNLIDSILFEKLLKEEKNETEIFFDEGIKIKENETIGYVGNTGCLFPHLHFEIRKNMDIALNPFKFIEIQDTIPPYIEKILLIPLARSIINSSHFPLIVKKGGTKIYGKGEFMIWIKTYDRWENGNKTGIYGIKIFKDDSLIFSKKMDSIVIDNHREGNLFYFKDTRYYSKSWYHPLWISINVDRDVNIKVVVFDYTGNKDSLSFKIENKINWDALARKINIPSSFYFFDGIVFREGKNVKNIYAILNDEKIQIEKTPMKWYNEFKWLPPPFFEGKVKFLFEGKENSEKEIYVFFSEEKIKSKIIDGIEIKYKSPFPLFFYAEIKNEKINILPNFAIFDTFLIKKELKEKEYWVYNGKFAEKESAFAFKGGTFEIRKDTMPPNFIGNKIIYSKNPFNIRFYVYDKESGIDGKGIKFYIDGKFFPLYYHPIYGRLNLFKKIKLEKGEHEFSLKINDKAHNQLDIKGKIIIKE